jgi:hypothetical protein
MAPAVREGQEWLCEGRIRISFGEPPFHVSYRPPRLSGHGGRGALRVPRMAGVWGAGAPMVAEVGRAWACGPHTSLPPPVAPAVREGQEWLCEGRRRISFGEPPFHVSYRPPRLSGHGGRGVLHVPRMAGVWGAGASMVAASGVLGPVALIPHATRAVPRSPRTSSGAPVISFPESQRRLNGPGPASRVLQKKPGGPGLSPRL